MKTSVPSLRIQEANERPVAPAAAYVLYWMVSARRSRFNFGLQRAADWSRELGRPLMILEAVRVGYPWASERLHGFLLDGMADNRSVFFDRNVTYLPYVEPERGAGSGLLETLAEDAAVVVTDHFPTFFLPRMVASAARRVPVLMESVDSNGLIPLAATGQAFPTAHAFRRWIQKNLANHLDDLPLEDPLAESLPAAPEVPGSIFDRWPMVPRIRPTEAETLLARLPIDHAVPVTATRGGAVAGRRVMRRFLDEALAEYGDKRNRPDDGRSSGLSPYLHFGHISPHEVFLEVMRRERWSPEDVAPPPNGRRAGWWGIGASAEAFLDQLITWRELGYQFCHHRPDHEKWSSLPDWAQATLTIHATDTRDHLYDLDDFAAAATHDPLWNAAQTQLVREGIIHNYLRMLWGKKILEWTESPQQALEIMLELNNRYALDGRDPNSVSGIFWVLGRHDRPWGPERPVFGKVRYMTSANTARKVPVKEYLARYRPGGGER